MQILFGDQIFNSDNWGDYSEEQIDEIKGLLLYRNREIKEVIDLDEDHYQVKFAVDKNEFVAHINLTNKEIQCSHRNKIFSLQAFESVVLNA